MLGSDLVDRRQGDETLPLSEHNPFSAMWGLDSSVPTYQRSLRTILSSAAASQAAAEGSGEGADFSSMHDVFSLASTRMHEAFSELFYLEPVVSFGLPTTGLTFHK